MSDMPAPDAVEQEARKLWGQLQLQVREPDRVEWDAASDEIRAECLRVVKAHAAE